MVYGGLIPNERGYERTKAVGICDVVLVGATTEGYCRVNLKRQHSLLKVTVVGFDEEGTVQVVSAQGAYDRPSVEWKG